MEKGLWSGCLLIKRFFLQCTLMLLSLLSVISGEYDTGENSELMDIDDASQSGSSISVLNTFNFKGSQVNIPKTRDVVD